MSSMSPPNTFEGNLESMTDVLRKEFWFMTVVGCCYGFFHSKLWTVATILNYIICYSVMFLTMFFLAYTVYLVLDQISYLSQALHLLIVGLVAMTASLTLTFHRRTFEEFKDFYANPRLCEYAYDEYFDDLNKKTSKKKKILIVTWMVIYGVCGTIGLSQKFIDALLGVSSDFSNVNGAWLTLPIVMWFPADLEKKSTAWSLAYILQSLFVAYSATLVTSAVVLCLTTCDRLVDQYKLLIYSINILDRRAKKKFYLRFPKGNMKQMAKEYDDCYYECIVQNFRHHLKTRELFMKFTKMASIPIAVPFFGGAILLGMALITMTVKDDKRIGPKCVAASLAVAEAYNMFTLCKIGQEFQELSRELYDALFTTRWYNRSAKCKKAIQIMMWGSFYPTKVTAAKLLDLNMELFADLVNSAYSIFNLMAISDRV